MNQHEAERFAEDINESVLAQIERIQDELIFEKFMATTKGMSGADRDKIGKILDREYGVSVL
jgi:hypothetical protein